MRCIFCKLPSTGSISKEHIIPESLGNKRHVLPPGWVCDECNNYIARKVEAPFLNSWYGTNARFEMGIPNKRGGIPPAKGVHPKSGVAIDIYRDIHDDHLSICAASGKNERRLIQAFLNNSHGTIFIPAAIDPPEGYEVSRFIAKVALEILANRCIDQLGWNEEIVGKAELDDIRHYVRHGRPSFVWPIYTRRIYPADRVFTDPDGSSYQILNEWDLLCIPSSRLVNSAEVYAVIAILGVEYTVNLGGPAIDGYINWLKEHAYQSILLPQK